MYYENFIDDDSDLTVIKTTFLVRMLFFAPLFREHVLHAMHEFVWLC